MIPNKFKIAGGKIIKVLTPDFLEDDDEYKFGEFNSGPNIINVAKKVCIDNKEFEQTKEDMERTFLHELFHSFQFYAGLEMDESEAQVFSNFMYEYLHTKE